MKKNIIEIRLLCEVVRVFPYIKFLAIYQYKLLTTNKYTEQRQLDFKSTWILPLIKSTWSLKQNIESISKEHDCYSIMCLINVSKDDKTLPFGAIWTKILVAYKRCHRLFLPNPDYITLSINIYLSRFFIFTFVFYNLMNAFILL